MSSNKLIQLLIGFNLLGWSFLAHPGDVPQELFAISLGSIFQFGYQNNRYIDNVPKKKFAGIKKSAGKGIQYYYQPLKEYENFAYVEKTMEQDTPQFITSFKLYLLPVTTMKTTQSNQLNINQPQWEVLAIDWFDDVKSENEAYHWAKNLCQVYTNDISIDAEITDFSDANWYECRFSSSNRSLNIGGMSARIHISLSFEPDLIIEKEKAASEAFLELQPKPSVTQ